MRGCLFNFRTYRARNLFKGFIPCEWQQILTIFIHKSELNKEQLQQYYLQNENEMYLYSLEFKGEKRIMSPGASTQIQECGELKKTD